ncbi:ATP-binding protein [Actinoplanes sp. NPDC023801]|uniref:ATP-binding protein n=1 Tax=Actinoplanes sp. NPDC023801 TaxID=3154595 RepID=UPI0034031B3D
MLDDAAVVVSELVSNAVRHGGSEIVVAVESHAGQITVSVADGSSVVPRPRDPDGTCGLGLRLIESLTVRWYVQSHEGGKRVCAELWPVPGSRDGGSDGTNATGSSRTEAA